MATNQHTDDLRNVREGDRVTIETTTGRSFDADCVDHTVQHDEGINITQTNIWEFEVQGVSGAVTMYAVITDGLSGTEKSPFPDHSQIWNETAEENLGYIVEVEIHGEME